MKKVGIAIWMLVTCLAVFITCKKDPEVNIEEFEIATEELTVGSTLVSIVGTYSYSGKIEGIKAFVADNESFAHAKSFEAEIEGRSFTIELEDLKAATTYHYYYSIDYGFNKPYKTESKSFSTLSESPTVKTLEALPLDSMTYRLKCEVLSDGGQEVSERGICWNTYGDPTLDDETVKHANGGLGQYTVRLEGLSPSTKYYVRAYAKNASGIGLGNVIEIQTGAEVTLPQVSTVEILGVTSGSATCKGNVSSDGGATLTECGVCWSLSANPTINGSHNAATEASLGVFQVSMNGLAPNKTYHVRAYASNVKGTAYGDDLTFTTTEGLPVVTTSAITNVTATSAKGGGEVTDQGASNVTERGICWGTDHNPTTADSHASSGTGAGSYTVSMTNLTPNATYYVRAYAKNSQGTSYGAEVSFTALEGLPTVQTQSVTDITSNSAKGHGKVTDQGGSTVSERGVCWSTSPSPSISGSHANNGTGAGEYSVNMSGLTPGTKYYVRAYAKNAQGTVYGEQTDFTTSAALPTVTTTTPSNVTSTSATGGGNVTNSGGASVTERGICWSTSHNPTTSGSHTSSGTGTGSFTANMTGLTPGTTYYVRAYAINSAGISYGDEKSLTTVAIAPTVTTGQVSNITQTTAMGSGNVTASGGASVTERGVCWSTSHNPTISSSHQAASASGTGSFTVNMTGLTANTHYYVRAYAKNSAGTSYGSEVDFTTSQDVSAPTVTTSTPTNVTSNSATCGGNVTASGGATVTERGVCWSTSSNPTTSGSHLAASSGGTGTFTVSVTGLTSGTTYHVRAYAKNSQGTSYGEDKTFTTDINAPTVTTSTPTNIATTSATCGGNVTDNGGATVTERGVCWSASHNPTTSSGNHASSGTGTGSFVVNMTGLTANTTYYVRAYAINSAGTAYGNEVNFTTSEIPSYNIAVSASPSNGGTVNGGGTYQQGQSCTVSAMANTGYTFLRWTENGDQVSTNANYTFTVSVNRTLVAQFQAQSYTISVSANPSNGGTVSGGGSYSYGQSCMVTSSANSGYEFTNWTEDGSQVSTNASYSFTVNSNRALVANFNYSGGGNVPAGAINGLFSVSATQQVWFSQGNLQYQASTNTWRFAENQWDYVGGTYNGNEFGTVFENGIKCDNSLISSSYSGWIDLFGWGTSGYNHGAICYQPWSTSEDGLDYTAYWPLNNQDLNDQTGQADWGYNAISNGGNTTNTWRTMTWTQFKYLMNTRNTASGMRYVSAKVNDIYGKIILPDDWDNSFYPLNNTQAPNIQGYESNTISSTEWIELEQHGAVFLPCAGHREMTQFIDNQSPYYWTSTGKHDGNMACAYYNWSNGSYTNRRNGHSVRLIQDYNP